MNTGWMGHLELDALGKRRRFRAWSSTAAYSRHGLCGRAYARQPVRSRNASRKEIGEWTLAASDMSDKRLWCSIPRPMNIGVRCIRELYFGTSEVSLSCGP